MKKQSKETEKERPPWRSATTSTQPEAKRKTLLRAKILDATRRALLAQRISHVGTQTESSAVLMREKSIDVQKDLIQMVDKSEDTDGAITIRRDDLSGCKTCLINIYKIIFKHDFFFCSNNYTNCRSND